MGCGGESARTVCLVSSQGERAVPAEDVEEERRLEREKCTRNDSAASVAKRFAAPLSFGLNGRGCIVAVVCKRVPHRTWVPSPAVAKYGRLVWRGGDGHAPSVFVRPGSGGRGLSAHGSASAAGAAASAACPEPVFLASRATSRLRRLRAFARLLWLLSGFAWPFLTAVPSACAARAAMRARRWLSRRARSTASGSGPASGAALRFAMRDRSWPQAGLRRSIVRAL